MSLKTASPTVFNFLSRPAALACWLCAAALAFYLWLIRVHPVVYWYDAAIRLALHDQVLLGRWPPLLQTIIFLAARVTTDLTVLRAALALVAAGAIAAAYRLAAHWFRPSVGLTAAAWLAGNVMFAALATVAYPEVLFMGLVLGALWLADSPRGSRRFWLGVAAVNLACLTRYEGWLLALALAAESVAGPLRRGRWRAALGRSLQAALRYGPVPLLWIAVSAPAAELLDWGARLKAIIEFETGVRGAPLSAQILPHLTLGALREFAAQYWQMLYWQARPEMLLLAGLGAVAAFQLPNRRPMLMRVLAFLGLDLLLLAGFRPWESGGLRHTFVLLTFLILLAAAGLESLIHVLSRRFAPVSRWRQWILVGAAVGLTGASVRSANAFVAGAAHEPDMALPAQVGAWLREHVPPDAVVLVLTTNAYQPYPLAVYSGLPLARILDEDRFGAADTRREIRSARWVYVVALPASITPLSAGEASVLADLEAGRLADRRFDFGPARVWVCRSAQWDTGRYTVND